MARECGVRVASKQLLPLPPLLLLLLLLVLKFFLHSQRSAAFGVHNCSVL